MQWPSANAQHESDHHLIGVRCVGYDDFGGVHVVKVPDPVFIGDRHHDHGTWPSHFFGGGNDVLALMHGCAHRGAKTGVDQRCRVLQFTGGADDGTLAIALHVVGGDPESRNTALRQQAADFGTQRVQRRQVLYVLAGIGVGDDGGDCDLA